MESFFHQWPILCPDLYVLIEHYAFKPSSPLVSHFSSQTIKKCADADVFHEISKNPTLTLEFIGRYKLYLDWLELSIHKTLNDDALLTYCDKVHWSSVLKFHKVSLRIIRMFIHRLDRDLVVKTQKHVPHKMAAKLKKKPENYRPWFDEENVRRFRQYANWTKISQRPHLSLPFIREFQKYVDWVEISRNSHLSLSFIREFQNQVHWRSISRFRALPIEFLEEFQERIHWSQYSLQPNIDSFTLRRFKHKMHWENVTKRSVLPTLLDEFGPCLDWDHISVNCRLGPDTVKKYRDFIRWDLYSSCQRLSLDIIREFKDYVDWEKISQHQYLTQSILREFKHCVDWKKISRFQVMDEKTVQEFIELIDKDQLAKNKALPGDIIFKVQRGLIK